MEAPSLPQPMTKVRFFMLGDYRTGVALRQSHSFKGGSSKDSTPSIKETKRSTWG